MVIGNESECLFDDTSVALYADEDLLDVAAPQINAFNGPSSAPGTALAVHLAALWRQYCCGMTDATHGPLSAPLQRRFEVIAQTNPAARAVASNGRLLTYGELDAQADALALQLQRDGLAPGSFCVLSLEPSLALARAVLAVLKAGAACLEFDPALPGDRIAAVLDVLRPALLFVRDCDCSGPICGGMRTIRCNEDAEPLPHGWPDEHPVLAGAPAHVFVTSSDGGGLCMKVRTHRALGACLDTIRAARPLTAADPASFWWPLSAGALLDIAPRA